VQQNDPLQQFCEIQDNSAADLLSIRGFYALEVASGKWSESGLVERAGIVQSSRGESMTVRCGIGYDLHRLAEGRKLIVGGIELPFDKGPIGHSDGDVLAHALCDALLGAAGLGDIGTHFPDTDPQWKGANSLVFLEHAKKLLDGKGFVIEWIDAVVITEKPKLGPHFPRMREALAGALRISVDHIHLKAKTNEGVDAVGRGEAIASYVVVTLSMD
jgi:2-C-methyl-D-erythritol 2,4-cyclodiphosphate synthase